MIDKVKNDVVNVLLAPVDILFTNKRPGDGTFTKIEEVLVDSGKRCGIIKDTPLEEIVKEITSGRHVNLTGYDVIIIEVIPKGLPNERYKTSSLLVHLRQLISPNTRIVAVTFAKSDSFTAQTLNRFVHIEL